MTGRELITVLESKMQDIDLDLPIVGVHSASGVSYEINCYGSIDEVHGQECSIPLYDMKVGDKYIRVSLD